MTEMDFDRQERILLLLYFADDRAGAIENLKEMKRCLAYDERELKALTVQVIGKLQKLTDEEYLLLNFWDDL